MIVADIPELITLLLDKQCLDPDHHLVQLGLDGGQNILKVYLIVRDTITSLKEAKHQLSEIKIRDPKLSSVKKLMIVAA